MTAKELKNQFHKEGEHPVRKNQITPNMRQLNGTCDLNFSVNLMTSLQFPVHISHKFSHVVMWSDSKKSVLFIELNIPWEENREEWYEQKRKNIQVNANCVEKDEYVM